MQEGKRGSHHAAVHLLLGQALERLVVGEVTKEGVPLDLTGVVREANLVVDVQAPRLPRVQLVGREEVENCEER